LTKNPVDDGFPKIQMPLEDANLIIENTIRMLEENEIGVRELPSHPAAKTKLNGCTFRGRLGRIMYRLYDLEICDAPEKHLKVDLNVDLYQMEDY
jgi:hypothetical protein